MKIKITESDINKMVKTAIKRVIKEEVTREMINNSLSHVVADAYERVFNEKAPIMNPNAVDLIYQRYANATPQQKIAFERELKGESNSEPIELLGLDDIEW